MPQQGLFVLMQGQGDRRTVPKEGQVSWPVVLETSRGGQLRSKIGQHGHL